MNIIGKRKIYFLLSTAFLIPGVISLLLFGLKFSIDFTGGSIIELAYSGNTIEKSEIEKILMEKNIQAKKISISDTLLNIQTNPIEQKTKTEVVSDIKDINNTVSEKGFTTVGPIIGRETQIKALQAVIIASLFITIYVALAFRKVSYPVSSWKFGVVAIITLLHDILIVVGIFSVLGYLFAIEIDTLFITALLTIMGFSVHDTIVVFDRIRENLIRAQKSSFEKIVNNAIGETLNRSLNTSITVVLVLFALLLFSDGSIRLFVIALLIGIIVGTYSSIFTASPLLVVWHEWDKKRKN